MGNRYIVARDAHTPTAANDSLTLISAANRRIRVISIDVVGRGATSAAQQFQITTNPAGTTPGGAIVPTKFEHSEQPAAVFTTATTWAAQPAMATNYTAFGWNALGGANRWTTPNGQPKGAFEARNGEVISIRAPAGITYQACSFSVVVEED